MNLGNLRTINVKNAIGTTAIVLALGASASPAMTAGRNECKNVRGKGEWTLIPSPNDPFGRVLGPTTGALTGAMSAYLTSPPTPTGNPDGSVSATSIETWVLGPHDVLQFEGAATFTPVQGAPLGTVSDSLTLNVLSGTGKYAGATGTLHVTGTGYNLFGPNAGPGNTFFDVRYEGTICTAN